MADSFVSVTFVADELLTSTKMNLLAANQAGFHDGTALGDGIIVTRHVGSASQLQLESYSTTERMTRQKWTNGKPVYTRTLSFSNPTTDGVIPHGLSIQEPIRIEVKRGVEAIGVGFMHTATSGIFFRFDNANITIRNMGSLSSQPCQATLYYTKP